jgi:hypothetical protein
LTQVPYGLGVGTDIRWDALSSNVFEKASSANEFHGKEPEIVVEHQLIKSDEVWMDDSRQGTKLSFEAVE